MEGKVYFLPCELRGQKTLSGDTYQNESPEERIGRCRSLAQFELSRDGAPFRANIARPLVHLAQRIMPFGLSDLTSRATTATLGKSSWTKYIDIFWTLMLISVAAVPLALVLRTIKLGTGAPAAH